jgi:SAM-dependent methyltransferase
MDPSDTAAERVERALWTLLGELTSLRERRALMSRLLSAPELERVRNAWRQTPGTAEGPGAAAEPGREDAPHEAFVRVAYERLLGRPADDGGLIHYAGALASGERPSQVLRALMLSDEFGRRVSGVPADTQLCELANPAKWDNPEWIELLRSLQLGDDKLAMHRKPYELTQLLYGCRRLGVLRDAAQVISVGAGHERVLYWLANHVSRVVATDRYEGVWQAIQGREGDPGVLRRPEAFAPFSYRRERLAFMRMDGRRLAFADATFDIAYSLSSIEHIGGPAGAADAVREMGRVLRPGGILAIATEYVIAGPPHEETFQPDAFDSLIDQPGLELVEPIDRSVYRRYDHQPVDLYANPYQTPHMVVRFNDTVFTTVMVFLRKKGLTGARP